MPSAQRGMALLMVLAIVALITVFAAGAVSLTLSRARDTQAVLATRQAQWQVESALVRLAQLTQDADASRHPSRTAGPLTWDLLGEPVTLTVVSQASRVDLNVGDPVLMGAVLRGAGLSAEQAQSVVRRWRGDAAAALLQDSGPMAVGPAMDATQRPHRWHSVSEAMRALGDLALPAAAVASVRCVHNAFTVQSFRVDVDAAAAEAEVRAGLTWAANEHWLGRNWTAAAPTGAETVWLGPPMTLDVAVSRHYPVQRVGLRLTGARHQPVAVYWHGRLPDGSTPRDPACRGAG